MSNFEKFDNWTIILNALRFIILIQPKNRVLYLTTEQFLKFDISLRLKLTYQRPLLCKYLSKLPNWPPLSLLHCNISTSEWFPSSLTEGLHYWPARKDFFREISAMNVLAELDSIHFIVKLSIHVLQGDSAGTHILSAELLETVWLTAISIVMKSSFMVVTGILVHEKK